MIQTHDLEVLNPNCYFAHLLYIGYIDAEFEKPTPYSYWDVLREKYKDAWTNACNRVKQQHQTCRL